MHSTFFRLLFGTLLLLPAALLASELQSFRGCTLIQTEWADADSFQVRFPDGKLVTIRLYGADAIEWHVRDATDARRLRSQRRYFGISDYGGSPAASIALAKAEAEFAARAVFELLSKPFTVHTAFADGRGSTRYPRIYAFVATADGQDLANLLVQQGMARAYGVYRSTPWGSSRDDYIEQLKDAELAAAGSRQGTWRFTDWEALPDERLAQRREEAEAALAIGNAPPDQPLDLNKANRDQLMSIPGIGSVTADRIIQARPFQSVDDLQRVNGIGPATLEKIRPYFDPIP